MKRLSIQIKKIPFRIFLRPLWLISVFIILSCNLFFPLFSNAEKTTELSENQNQTQPISEDSQIYEHDFSMEHPFLQFLELEEDGGESLLLKHQKTYVFLPRAETDITIFQQKSSEFENTHFSSNLDSNEPDKKLEIFRLKQKTNDFIYGVEYRCVGKDIKNLEDYKKKTNIKTNIDLKPPSTWTWPWITSR